jgi:hypothetical protein
MGAALWIHCLWRLLEYGRYVNSAKELHVPEAIVCDDVPELAAEPFAVTGATMCAGDLVKRSATQSAKASANAER